MADWLSYFGPRGWLAAWFACSRRLADHQHLSELDDYLLRDMGLTRADVARGLRDPPQPDRGPGPPLRDWTTRAQAASRS